MFVTHTQILSHPPEHCNLLLFAKVDGGPYQILIQLLQREQYLSLAACR